MGGIVQRKVRRGEDHLNEGEGWGGMRRLVREWRSQELSIVRTSQCVVLLGLLS